MITSHLICNERIAELEAELAALKAAPNYAAQATVECAEYTIDGLLAELAALKARRCETCHYGDDHMLARCRECRFGDMWTTPAEAKP